ncbi:ABC transporter substrate-binding protein [Anaerosporobacter sp.]|uniref:ABC transporter substrate-binding protein n=1 Tax=Anaerosporobacter sp. TaxID=1872529 RepID=UPI00286EF298|nr:ABC transporter substrate-binding protein [Anaerosporobacter sp.]
MKKRWKKIVGVLLTVALIGSLTACGGKKNDEGTKATTSNAASDVVTIGVSDTIGSLNPMLLDGTEVMKYAISLQFLPLLELNKNMEFEGQIATEIVTEDNKTFTIKLDEKAAWSDGEPITSKDVLFSFLCWASPEIGSTGMSIYNIEGTGDDGFVEAGSDHISGVVAVDEKTVQITTKIEMALSTFQNIYGRYILIMPEHILGDVPKDQMVSYEWFNAPTVVSGPYIVKDFDLNHYVTYVANEKYFKGAPKIENLSIKVVTPSQLLTGLQSGEIDLVQQTMGSILQEDYESVKKLENITVYDGTPVTTQSIFFNTEKVTNVKVRQAFLYGMDRELILQEFLKGKGEIVDGFLASAGPYYDSSIVPVAYDKEKAKQLLEEAKAEGWDASTEYNFYVNSGDTTFTQVATYLAAQFAEIGLKIKINTVDLSTLMTVANEGDFDLMAVQYTYAPVDVYTDASWLLSAGGWTRYENDVVTKALIDTQLTVDTNEIKELYRTVDAIVQTEVPMIDAYVISGLGAKSNRLQNATPDVYGTFINVQDWEIK